MSIDTLLEAARYLELQAQQQQLTHEEEQHKDKELINKEELRHIELVTSLSQPITANHVEDPHRQQPSAPPPPPRPPPPVPIAVIPMVPVVTAAPLPLTKHIAAASTLAGPPAAKTTTSPQPPPQPPPAPASHQLLCPPQMKADTTNQPVNCAQSQPQVHIQYPLAISTNGPAPQPALASHQAPPTSQLRPNGVTLEDMRGLEGKKRPGGTGTREVHNKLEKNRRAHLKECFETLKKNVPNVDEKKTSNLSVLRSALRYIQTLKRKEKEFEHEMERLARAKIATQQRLAELKNELSQCMDVMEIDRVLRQTIQPEDDQASTSTASEGEDNLELDVDQDGLAPPVPRSLARALTAAPILQTQPLLGPHLSIQHPPLPLSAVLATPPSSVPPPPQALAPTLTPVLPPSRPPAVQVQPTVIAHAAVSHPSVIQAVSHAMPANHKHLTHIAPSPIAAAPQPIAVATSSHQPIGHITVHPVAHLQSRLPTLYPQGMSVSQPTVVSHITHTFAHHTLPHVQANPQANAIGAQVNNAAVVGQGKPTAMLAAHPQLVGQAAVLNPVTMVTVPTFPVSTIKLA
ncbi:MAX network transcriptional repressor b [Nerophis ophidion]|uniref:MAX network transcriptional repressor b n=1 Tax=Nerophis ophidion TaxID=159077 RepID=UPI002ADF0DB2|nr:MAX network transcriptional repressor b [Nerophis ophidion]